jgi:hypothetical protein
MSAKDNSDKWRLHDNFMKLHKKAFPDLTNGQSAKRSAEKVELPLSLRFASIRTSCCKQAS